MGGASELWRASAREIVDGIKARSFSARDVVSSVIDRVDALNDKVNALVSVQHEDALARADELDADLAAGKPVLPLQGVPITTKINTDQRGVPTTNGVHFFADRVPMDDDACIANLRKAGAVIIGRSNAPAMSMRWTTENDIHGRTYNIWNRDVVPGGSSGGAAVAVATGMGPIAQGNDGGGSIRMPAFCAGVIGLRPTVGRVPAAAGDPNQPKAFGAGLISAHGPIGRSADDIRLMMKALVTPTYRDPSHVPLPFDALQGRAPCRVAVAFDPTGNGTDAWTRAALDHAASRLSDAGYDVVEATPPNYNDAVALWHALGSHARSAMGPLIEKHGDEGARMLNRYVQAWNTYEPSRFVAALDRRTLLQRQWDLFMQDYPLLLMPVLNSKPFAVGFDSTSQEAVIEMFGILAPMMPSSSLGLPAASVPTRLEDGLPGGVQLLATRWEEARILNAAEIIQGDFMTRPVDPAI